MKVALVAIGVALVLAIGCVRTDWIDRTLVTVDVSGNWYGTIAGGSRPEIWLELQEEGSKVTGSVRIKPDQGTSESGPIEGSISGDVFQYRVVRGSTFINLTVSGDRDDPSNLRSACDLAAGRGIQSPVTKPG